LTVVVSTGLTYGDSFAVVLSAEIINKITNIIIKYLGIPNYYFKGKMHWPLSECRG
jgi:hypothetical protein